jgi:hypothetical protein
LQSVVDGSACTREINSKEHESQDLVFRLRRGDDIEKVEHYRGTACVGKCLLYLRRRYTPMERISVMSKDGKGAAAYWVHVCSTASGSSMYNICVNTAPLHLSTISPQPSMLVLTAGDLQQVSNPLSDSRIRILFRSRPGRMHRTRASSWILTARRNKSQGPNKRMRMHGDGAPTAIRPGVRGRPTYLSFSNNQLDSIPTTHRQPHSIRHISLQRPYRSEN